MKPAVLMMFRDEADILEKCLRHWYDIGVRNFYLCDNGSVDDSQEIARAFLEFMLPSFSGRRHWVLRTDPATDWPGRRVINDLKIEAIKNGCDWIFPADADEFLQIHHFNEKGEPLTIAEWLSTYPQKPGWGELRYLNILPNGSAEWQEPQRKAFGLFNPEWIISMGNHLIEDVEPTLNTEQSTLFGAAFYMHYSLRSYEQFRRKMINYMKAFSQTQFTDHPHARDFKLWQIEGEAFLVNRWKALTEPAEEPAPKWL